MAIQNTHLTHDDLELYALNHTAGADEEAVEEHLLLCELCRNALDGIEQELRIFRICLRECETSSLCIQ